ncbi:MAG: PAS domain-containing protein [Campylobacterales bacterium]|nr:PAS domain-containing protein [Campylobacterales bacterium]
MLFQKWLALLLVLCFALLFTPIYLIIENNKHARIEMVLEKHRQNLHTHVQSFLHNQNDLADLVYDQTVSDEAILHLLEEAYSADESKRTHLRAQLIAMLEGRYRIYRKQHILQYHFVLADGTVFLRMHKKERFGDALHGVREDFKTVNEEQRIIRGFAQGRTAHGFRNVYPLFGPSGKHIGALEVSFASELLQDHLTLSSRIHSHFLVHKEVVDTRAWQRDDRVITYAPSMEHPSYLSHTPLNHQSAECLQNNPARIAALQESILRGMAQTLPFTLYSAEGDIDKVIGFYPIHHAISNRVVAWIVTYEDEPIIRNILANGRMMQATAGLLLLVVLLFIYRLLMQRHEMHRLNERFELVLKAINDGIWDWEISANSVYFSPQWKAMLGYDDLENRPERFFELIHPDDKERVQEVLEAHWRDPQIAPYHLQARLRCQDGRYKWILIRGKTVLDAEGKPTRMVGSHTDIDAMYRLQQDLAKHQKLLQSVFDLMAIGVSITDEQGNIIDCNRASEQILGVTKEEHLRRSYQGPYWQIVDEHQRPLSAEA